MDAERLRALSKEQLIDIILKDRQPAAPPSAAVAPSDLPMEVSNAPADEKKAKVKRGRESFDWGKHELGQVALKVAYCGWDYYGYASQACAPLLLAYFNRAKEMRTYQLSRRAYSRR